MEGTIGSEYQSLFFAASVIAILCTYRHFFCRDRPQVVMQNTERNKNLIDLCSILHKDYCFPFWAGSGHAQTLYAGGGRRCKLPNYEREELETSDGGVIVLDWLNRKCNPDTPIIIIVPGICSHSESHYIRHLTQFSADNGYRAVVFNARGCVRITTPKLFTYGDTNDIRQTVLHIRKTYPKSPLFGFGLSLGGNMLAKYIGESSAENEIQYFTGAISVSQGYDAKKGIEMIKERQFYNRHVTSKLTGLVKKHKKVFQDVVDLSSVLATSSVDDFDKEFTCKIHGFRDVYQYYEEHSCLPVLPKISIPFLLLNATDDPLVPGSLIPYNLANENSNIIIVTTKVGGHISWVEGWFIPKTVHWHERLGIEFFQALRLLKKVE